VLCNETVKDSRYLRKETSPPLNVPDFLFISFLAINSLSDPAGELDERLRVLELTSEQNIGCFAELGAPMISFETESVVCVLVEARDS